jgi:hypothetical protein
MNQSLNRRSKCRRKLHFEIVRKRVLRTRGGFEKGWKLFSTIFGLISFRPVYGKQCERSLFPYCHHNDGSL